MENSGSEDSGEKKRKKSSSSSSSSGILDTSESSDKSKKSDSDKEKEVKKVSPPSGSEGYAPSDESQHSISTSTKSSSTSPEQKNKNKSKGKLSTTGAKVDVPKLGSQSKDGMPKVTDLPAKSKTAKNLVKMPAVPPDVAKIAFISPEPEGAASGLQEQDASAQEEVQPPVDNSNESKQKEDLQNEEGACGSSPQRYISRSDNEFNTLTGGTWEDHMSIALASDIPSVPELLATNYVGAGSADPVPQYAHNAVPNTQVHRSRSLANRQRRESPGRNGEVTVAKEGNSNSSVNQSSVEKRSRSAHNRRSHNGNQSHRSSHQQQQLQQQLQQQQEQLASFKPKEESYPQITHPQNNSYNWQSTRTNVKERLQYMYNNEVMADVHFIVGKAPHTLRIPAHKFVLAISSVVFDAMFNGGMATTQNEIEIPDVEPSAFLALLRFVYTDDVQIGPETVMTTLYAAKKYAVPALESACVEFLKRNLCSENAFMLLTQARLFDEPQLAALCLETIDKNTNEALNAEGFTDIDLETLCVVLERDTLGIRECKLFSAVCRWAEAETQRQSLPVTPENQRAVLGRALDCIRFPLMTVEEFAVGAAQSGILTDREVVELFLHFTVNPKPGVKFLDTPRCCLTGKEQVVSRFCQIESRWGYSGTSDRIRFMVNRRIFVVGFGLYGSIHGASEYEVNIQIIHTDTGKVCGQNDTSFQCDGTTSTSRVMFKEPVEIQPNTNYTACATLKGPDSYYGTKGLRKVTHESLTSGKVTFQFTYAAGNNNGTSVEDGQLPEIIFYT